ncbi:MAG TPA: MFS transporter [Acidimicrobiaceae bacterium]|nr:MFS transporter [Acidimicrobiaceae bacterium]
MRTWTPEEIHSRRWVTLGVLCLSLLVIVVDSTIVNVALPTMVRQLHASTASLQWVTDAYTLAMAGLLLSLGSLGDRIGRHRTLAGGLVVFGVGSALAALSGSAGELIASRVVMGAGAAAIMPATLSILTNVFTVPGERAKAIAMWSAVSGLGVAVGPTLGGWLLEHFSWGSIFIVNVPIVVVALVAGRFVVPPTRDDHPKALDPVGLVTSIAGVVAVVYATIEAPTYGWLSARTVGVVTAGLAVLAGWVVYELRSSHPMVDLRVFRNARFSAASFSVTMIFLALFGWLFLFTQQMQFVLGYNTLQAGVRALPFAVTIGAVSQPAAKLAARVGTKAVVSTGLALMAVGFALMATSTAHTGYSFLLVASVVVAAGMGLAMAPATESIMGALPPAQAGVGSAVNDTTRSLGGALGVAVMGSVASSIFTSHIRPALAHVPAAVAAQAKTSVGAAVTIGHHAPASLGATLVDAARHAFITGADQAMIVATAAALLGSFVALRLLPAHSAQEVSVAVPEPAAELDAWVAAEVA